MGKFPEDCPARKICTRSRGIFGYQIDASIWEWHEQTGTDHGTDLILELVKDNYFIGRKIEGQLKGTTRVKKLIDGTVTYDFDIKTINYALGSAYAFVLFLVDVNEENIYFLTVQDFFITNPDKLNAVKNNKKTVTVHFDPNITLRNRGDDLVEVANDTYIKDESGLRRIYNKDESLFTFDKSIS